ncbi:MAG: hypothetical protein JWO80_3229 [Bryobacterales bacterium]|nr:hypothetical protein [Bryobacterales bacterium]
MRAHLAPTTARRTRIEANIGKPPYLADDQWYRALLSLIDPTDPVQIAGIAPRSALNLRITALPIAARSRDVLARHGIYKVNDLRAHTLRELRSWYGFGVGSGRELALAVRKVIEGDSPDTPLEDPASQDRQTYHFTPLVTCVNDTLSRLEPLPRAILRNRLLPELAQSSLGKIASEFNVSLEQVRKQNRRLLKDVIDSDPWPSILRCKVTALLAARGEWISIGLLEMNDPWFSGLHDQTSYIARLISLVVTEVRCVYERAEIRIVRDSRIPPRTFAAG